MGTIAYFYSVDSLLLELTGGALNDRGQVVLTATLTDGRVVLLVASPSGG